MSLSRNFEIKNTVNKKKNEKISRGLKSLDETMTKAGIRGDAEITIIDKNFRKGSKNFEEVWILPSCPNQGNRPIITVGPYMCLIKTATLSPQEIYNAVKSLLEGPVPLNPSHTLTAEESPTMFHHSYLNLGDHETLKQSLLFLYSFREEDGTITQNRALLILQSNGVKGIPDLDETTSKDLLTALRSNNLIYPIGDFLERMQFTTKAASPEWLDVDPSDPTLLKLLEPSPTKSMETPTTPPEKFSGEKIIELLGNTPPFSKKDVREAIRLLTNASSRAIPGYFTTLVRGGHLLKTPAGSYIWGEKAMAAKQQPALPGINPEANAPKPAPSAPPAPVVPPPPAPPKLQSPKGESNIEKLVGEIPSNLTEIDDYIAKTQALANDLQRALSTAQKRIRTAAKLQKIWKDEDAEEDYHPEPILD
jgi:hypothetical protein